MNGKELDAATLKYLESLDPSEVWYLAEHDGSIRAGVFGEESREVGDYDFATKDAQRCVEAVTWLGCLCREVFNLRRRADLDRQTREASQVEFARLNRELNEARARTATVEEQWRKAQLTIDELTWRRDERATAFEGIGR